MSEQEFTLYIICGIIFIFAVAFLALVIYWLLFARDYYQSLARYKKLFENLSAEQLDELYNREFPADYSIKEIQEFIKEGKDDPKGT